MKRPPPVIHPFMVATLFVLVCYREVQPFVKWEEMLGLWGLVMVVTYGVFRACKYFVDEPYKAALLTTLLLGAFCFYGDIEARLRFLLGRTRYIIAFVLAGTVVLSWLLLRTRKNLLKVKILLNVFISAMALATILYNHLYPVQFVSRRDRPREPDEQGPLSVTNNRPDIYYLVFDSFTSAESLKRFWNHDAGPFIRSLEDRGFIIVSNAHSNYDLTYRSLAASLNMKLLKQPPSTLSSFGRVNRAAEIIDFAAAPEKLREIGYEIVNLSLFDVAGEPQFYGYEAVDYSSLVEVMLRKSMYGTLQAYLSRYRLNRHTLRILERLERLPRETSAAPRFIYAHVLLPHAPYFYDRNGPLARPDLHPQGTPEQYLEQLIYTSGVITNVISTILSNSPRPPIIIVQGDHGFRWLRSAGREEEALSILNAYYLPGGKREWIYDGITPVNSFRMIFNHYFGSHYAYVPDRSFTMNMTLSTEPLTNSPPR